MKRWIIGICIIKVVLISWFFATREKFDPHPVFKIGDRVVVKFGYYEECPGTIVREVFSEDRIDREGHLHPSAFAGYAVNINCSQAVGERFFSPDFLKRKKK